MPRAFRGAAGPLTAAAALALIALLVAAVGLAVDHTRITAAPAWLKPAKFAVSISVYCATVAWLVSHVPGRARLLRAVSWGTASALVGESALIYTGLVVLLTAQAELGRPPQRPGIADLALCPKRIPDRQSRLAAEEKVRASVATLGRHGGQLRSGGL